MQVLVVKERVEEHVHADLREVKHLGSQVKTEWYRKKVQKRNAEHLDQIVQPRDKDEGAFVLSYIVPVLDPVGAHQHIDSSAPVFSQKIIARHNQLKHSKLEDPPDIDL